MSGAQGVDVCSVGFGCSARRRICACVQERSPDNRVGKGGLELGAAAASTFFFCFLWAE